MEWLLDLNIPGADALREQIPFAQAVDGTPDLPTYLHLTVAGVSPADIRDGEVPGAAVVLSASGEPTGFLILWVKNGYLESIEHAWVTDEMPREFPSPDRLRRMDRADDDSGKPGEG